MPLFPSDRERRLWILTLAVIVAIFSTLGLAATLAGAVGDRGLIDDFFFCCFLLVLAAVMAVSASAALGWARRRVGSRGRSSH